MNPGADSHQSQNPPIQNQASVPGSEHDATDLKSSHLPAQGAPRVYLPAHSALWGNFFILCGILFPLLVYGAFATVAVVMPLKVEMHAREQAKAATDPETQRRWENVALSTDEARKKTPANPGGIINGLVLAATGSLLLLGKRLRTKSALQILRHDTRPPVIYLRAFLDDPKKIGDVSEDKFARLLRKVGPVIAIGQPGEKLTRMGASRFYVSNERWQEAALDMMHSAQLVVLRAAATPGLLWEVERVRRVMAPQRLVLIIPFGHDAVLYERFRELATKANIILPDIPQRSALNRRAFGEFGRHILLFDENWQPQWLEERLAGRRKPKPNHSYKGEVQQLVRYLKRTLPQLSIPPSGEARQTLVGMLDEIMGETIPHPSFRLAPLDLLLIPLLIAGLWWLPGRLDFIDFDYTVFARSLEGLIGILTALALAFVVWLKNPASPRRWNAIFVGVLGVHLLLIFARYPSGLANAKFDQKIDKIQLVNQRDTAALNAFVKASQKAQKDKVIDVGSERLLDSARVAANLKGLGELRSLNAKASQARQARQQLCHELATSPESPAEIKPVFQQAEIACQATIDLLKAQDQDWAFNEQILHLVQEQQSHVHSQRGLFLTFDDEATNTRYNELLDKMAKVEEKISVLAEKETKSWDAGNSNPELDIWEKTLAD